MSTRLEQSPPTRLAVGDVTVSGKALAGALECLTTRLRDRNADSLQVLTSLDNDIGHRQTVLSGPTTVKTGGLDVAFVPPIHCVAPTVHRLLGGMQI